MVHLWSLELCSSSLYVLKKVFKFIIPNGKEDGKNIIDMGNFLLLKVRKNKQQ
jgi:hypothetical protein